MASDFSSFVRTSGSPGTAHHLLVANPDQDLDMTLRMVHCAATGAITLRDKNGTDLQYVMSSGQNILFSPKRVMSIHGGKFVGWE